MSGVLVRFLQRRALDESNASGLLSFLRGMGALWQTSAGVDVTPEGSLQSTAVFACVRVLAESVASLPLITYKRRSDGGKDRAPKHYLYPVLHDQANGEMTSFEWREVSMGHLCLWGNAYSEIESNKAGAVTALWPLRPDRTAVRRNKDTKKLEYVLSMPTGAPVVLPAERVLHLRSFGTNGIVGLSPIQMARQAIGLGMAAEEFGARFFGNGAIPGLVLQHPGKLSDEAYDRLKETWRQQHEGLSNAQRTAILEEGVTVEKIGIPPEDAQFLETRKFQTNEVARIFRVPPHMIGDLERATFSNIEQQSLDFVVNTLRPWLVRIEQSIARGLLTPSERGKWFAEFLVDGLLRGDIVSRYNAYKVGRDGGWLNVDEIRAHENMNPLPDGQGQIYLQPGNMQPVGAKEPEQPPADEGTGEEGGEDDAETL